jgi:chromosome segregation ATPase
MNANQIEILGTLRARIKELMKKCAEERAEKERLQTELGELKETLSTQKQRIIELEYRYDNLKTARSIALEGEDLHDARLKVNIMVREIDRCIALLNR